MGKDMGWSKGFKEAIKADTLSLIAFEVGLFGWMAIVHYVLFTKTPSQTQWCIGLGWRLL